MEYKRKTEEMQALLEKYEVQKAELGVQLELIKSETKNEEALGEVETAQMERSKTEFALLKETIKELEQQLEEKKEQGENIYNQMRDQVSLQEDKYKMLEEEVLRLKGSHVSRLQVEASENEGDLKRLQQEKREFKSHIPEMQT